MSKGTMSARGLSSKKVHVRAPRVHGARWLLLVATLAAPLLSVRAAHAGGRNQCADAAEDAQRQRDDGNYHRAREQLLACARAECPALVRSDCDRWLLEVDREGPTVVLGAKNDQGGDEIDVEVTMDGAHLLSRLDGKPVLVDSGEHTFTFAAPDGSTASVRIVARAAEKARPILVTLSRALPESKPQARTAPPSLVLPLVVAGVGVAAIGSFAFFGLSARSDVDDLEGCKPDCAKSRTDSVRTKLILADISLGAGLVAAGVATFLFWNLTRPSHESKRATKRPTTGLSFDAGPLHGGAYGSVDVRF